MSIFQGLFDIIDARLERTRWLGIYEFRVVTYAAGYADLQPVRRATGMPDLTNVKLWSGSPGASGEPTLGVSVLISFIDGDRTRPFVMGFEGEPGVLPKVATINASDTVEVGPDADLVELGSGSTPPTAAIPGRVVRYGDMITFGAPATTAPITFAGSYPISKVEA